MTELSASAGDGQSGIARSARSERIEWLDAARGAGIILVVIGHALGGLIDSPLGANLIGFRYAFYAIYTFHMPLFFLLSGLLVGKRASHGVVSFLKRLVPTLVWPYFLWSIVQFSVIYALGNLVNRPAGIYWETVQSIIWFPLGQFWFLYALFWMHVCAALMLPRVGRTGLVVLGIAMKLAVATIPELQSLPVIVRLFAANFVWYAIGVSLMPEGIRQLIVQRPAIARGLALPLVAAGVIGATLLLTGLGDGEIALAKVESALLAKLASQLPTSLAALFGIAAMIGIASLAAVSGRGNRGGSSLAQLGRLTMPIYLLHILFIAGTRIVLVNFAHVTNSGVLLVLLVAAGLIGPLLVERVVRPTGLQRWLGF